MTSSKSASIDKSMLICEFNENDLRHFRHVAFIAVVLSTVTMFACVILLPISYQYIQRIQSTVTNDIEFCRVNYFIIHIILNFFFLIFIEPKSRFMA